MEQVGPKLVAGWVERDAHGTPPLVRLVLNGTHLAETYAGREAGAEGSASGFAFTVAGIWPLLGAGDTFEVLLGDEALPFPNGGARHVLDAPLTSRSDEILAKVAQGHLLSRKGHLRFPLGENVSWARDTFSLFDEIVPIVREVTGSELTPSYGTLLGCIRSGSFIKHDDDFDGAYLSRHSTPEDVRAEVARLFHVFVDRGYAVRMGKQAANLVKVMKGKRSVDIFYAWFDENDEYGISYGYHGEPVKRADFVEGERIAELAGRQVLVPRSAEKLLAQFYGPGWRVPDHGFSHASATRRIDGRYTLDRHTAEKLYWNSFYARNALKDASSFAALVRTKLPDDCLLFDIGCGTGKDAVFFSENGVATVGIDASHEGIKRASDLGDERGAQGLSFQVVDVGSKESLDQLFSGERFGAAVQAGVPLVFYMRFFLHSIKDDVEAVLFNGLKANAPRGSLLAVEFRTDKDKDLPKAVKDKHFRRYMDPARFARRLESAYGFEVTLREESFGWSIFNGEDPHLCRLFARKS